MTSEWVATVSFYCFIVTVLITKCTVSDTGRIQIFVTFGDLRACLSLDAKSNNKLLDLQVLHALDIHNDKCYDNSYMVQILSDAMKSKADAAEMLSSCATLSSPDDIKQAMFYLRSSQLSQQAIKKDVIELRKKIIVTSKGPYLFDVTFQSGATATLKVHMSYPHFVGGVVVENISTSYDVSTPSLDAESIKIHANKIMCSTLAEMYCVLNDRFT